MDSQNDEIEQSTTELKYLGFVNEISVKFLVLLSNVYDFAKENSDGLKTTIDYVENVVVSVVGPEYEKLKDVPERILVFVDDKFDKYSPNLVKNLVTKIETLTEKTIPVVEKLLVSTWSLVSPLILTTLTLLQKLIAAVQSIPTVQKAEAFLQKLISTVQSLLRIATNAATSALQSLLLKAITAATSAIQSLLVNLSNVPIVAKAANHLLQNPLLNAVYSMVRNIATQAQGAGAKVALQAAYASFKVVGLPVIAQFWYKANTYPLVNTVAEVVLPVVEYGSEVYNKVVAYMDGRGYSVSGYLPLVPIDEMKAAYKVVKMAMDGLSAVGGLVGMDNGN